MDSFILYNAETDPEDIPNGIEVEPKEIKKSEDIATEPKEILNERSIVRIQEMSNDKEKPDDKENPNTLVKKDYTTPDTNYEHEILWHLEFDGSAGACLWVYNLENDHAEGHVYRLNFKCTNNMAEYEALLLGLKLVKRLGAIRVSIMGDFELIVKQIKEFT